jgi:integrase/recombinase XerC
MDSLTVKAGIEFLAARDARAVIADWQRWLAEEKRVSPHTFDADSRDLAAFLTFLAAPVDPVRAAGRPPQRWRATMCRGDNRPNCRLAP